MPPPDRSLGRAFSTSMPPPVQTYTSYAYNEELNKNGLESLPSNYFCDQSRFSQRRENFFQTGGAEP